MLVRLVYICLVGLVGAIFVHLSIVMLIPSVAPNTAWLQVKNATQPAQIMRIGEGEMVNQLNGLNVFEYALICRYDLNEGALVFSAFGDVPYWSLAVHSSAGEVIYSANGRTAGYRSVDIAVLNGAQVRRLRQELPVSYADRVIVSADGDEGFVMIRVLKPDPSWQPAVDAFLSNGVCKHEPV